VTLIRDGYLRATTADQFRRSTDKLVKTYAHPDPACGCGKKLSTYNPDPECWQCMFNRESDRLAR
jgi:hypothetical protein